MNVFIIVSILLEAKITKERYEHWRTIFTIWTLYTLVAHFFSSELWISVNIAFQKNVRILEKSYEA